MPSERNTPPTMSRIRSVAPGASDVRRRCARGTGGFLRKGRTASRRRAQNAHTHDDENEDEDDYEDDGDEQECVVACRPADYSRRGGMVGMVRPSPSEMSSARAVVIAQPSSGTVFMRLTACSSGT